MLRWLALGAATFTLMPWQDPNLEHWSRAKTLNHNHRRVNLQCRERMRTWSVSRIRVAYWECPLNPHCDFECLLYLQVLRSKISNPRERKCLTPQHTVWCLNLWCSFHLSIYREANCDDLIQKWCFGSLFACILYWNAVLWKQYAEMFPAEQF